MFSYSCSSCVSGTGGARGPRARERRGLLDSEASPSGLSICPWLGRQVPRAAGLCRPGRPFWLHYSHVRQPSLLKPAPCSTTPHLTVSSTTTPSVTQPEIRNELNPSSLLHTPKRPACPSTDEGINKTWSVRTTDYRSALSRNEVRAHGTMRMNLENVMSRERSQTQKATDFNSI